MHLIPRSAASGPRARILLDVDFTTVNPVQLLVGYPFDPHVVEADIPADARMLDLRLPHTDRRRYEAFARQTVLDALAEFAQYPSATIQWLTSWQTNPSALEELTEALGLTGSVHLVDLPAGVAATRTRLTGSRHRDYNHFKIATIRHYLDANETVLWVDDDITPELATAIFPVEAQPRLNWVRPGFDGLDRIDISAIRAFLLGHRTELHDG